MKFDIMEARSSAGLIYDWSTLGAALQITPKILAYTLMQRSELQTKLHAGKRIVWDSAKPLAFVQSRIHLLVASFVDELPDEQVIIAYRKGKVPVDILREYSGSHTLITVDIKKYFPSIKLRHITHSLMKCGMSKTGAKLVGRYCIVHTPYTKKQMKEGGTVEDTHPDNIETFESMGTGYTELQQGSIASSAVSNLVGYYYIDEPIIAWLKEKDMWDKVHYVRYCDNITLFCKDAPPENFYTEYKEFLTLELAKEGFRLHSWSCINNTNPSRNQKFLGVIFNHNARVDTRYLDKQRAIFYGAAREGFAATAVRMFEDRGGEQHANAMEFVYRDPDMIAKKVKMRLQGNATYIGMVNKKHGKWLKKLYKAAVFLDGWRTEANTAVRRELCKSHEFARKLFTYKNDNESVQYFMSRIKSWAASNG